MVYLEMILERLNNPYLKEPDNQGRQVIDGTVCEYLENYNNHFLDLWVSHSTGDFLDVIGRLYGLMRQEDESDVSFRGRILADTSMVESTSDIGNAGVDLFCLTTGDFGDCWTSDNLYLCHSEYFALSDETTQGYVEGKFIMEDLEWVTTS